MAQSPGNILSHWYHLFEGIQHSTQDFYSSLDGAIAKRNLPDIRVSRTQYHEGGAFSAKREYLRVKRKTQFFDVCAAPYGNGFFVSWWLGESEGCLSTIPIIGWFVSSLKPMTYYQIDTTLMFQESIRLAVLEVIDGMTKVKGLKELSEADRKPILHELLKK